MAKSATLSEMVAEYNQLTGKSIKKFSDRPTAIRKLKAARVLAISNKKPNKAKSTSSPTKKKGTKTHYKVLVDGKTYPSAQSAFTALKVPMSGLGRVRKELKANGKASFDDFNFKLIQS